MPRRPIRAPALRSKHAGRPLAACASHLARRVPPPPGGHPPRAAAPRRTRAVRRPQASRRGPLRSDGPRRCGRLRRRSELRRLLGRPRNLPLRRRRRRPVGGFDARLRAPRRAGARRTESRPLSPTRTTTRSSAESRHLPSCLDALPLAAMAYWARTGDPQAVEPVRPWLPKPRPAPLCEIATA